MTKATVAGFAGEATRLMRERLTPAVWAVLAILTVAATLVSLKPAGDQQTNMIFMSIATLSWLISLWVTAVIIRFLAAFDGRRWELDMPVLRFFLSQFAVALLTGAIMFEVQRITARGITPQTAFAINFAAPIVISLLVLPFAAWFAALAVGDRSIGLVESARRTGAAVVPLAGALLLLVLPVQLLHSVVSAAAVRSVEPLARIGLGVADGLISALLLALPAALFVAAWRYVRGEADHTPLADDIG